jgi:hypothetical protein
MAYMAEHGWKEAMTQSQQAIMYTLVVIVVGMMLTMVGVMSMVYSSFVSNMFTAGVTPMKIMRVIGKFPY